MQIRFRIGSGIQKVAVTDPEPSYQKIPGLEPSRPFRSFRIQRLPLDIIPDPEFRISAFGPILYLGYSKKDNFFERICTLYSDATVSLLRKHGMYCNK
jgi:hypothetical protein